ncbi:IS607 family transposase [Rhodococcus sp. MSC1_016]|jgi:predicted site-specific integrase-resolvase|uniref:hypothetical protein n=1 Tax=Rhodococcus sp. MSC1_016 TaxID=2909266 RepID=UPI00202EB553|nr:hypothetical protein [Rhodococcus sp. MSC1_016]
MLDDAAKGHFTVVRVVWRDRLVRFGVAWIERYLSVVGVTVDVLREHGDTSVGEELIDDFMALPASLSGRFYQFAVEAESTPSSRPMRQHGLLG